MMSSVNHDGFAHLKTPLEDVISATNNFAKENFRGEGGFGNHYEGQLLLSGELIKIHAQRWNKEWDEKEEQFWMEISVLSSLKHKNLVSLVGFCDENDEKIIIIKLETMFSLDNYLDYTIMLTWVRRLEICVGLAHALSYIHYEEHRDFSVIHRNIDSETILINDNFEPKLSEFRLSMKIEASGRHHSFRVDKVWDIEGYTDPAYIETNNVSHKSDIYSFGIVMFELLCGRKSIITDEGNKYLAPSVILHYREEKLNEIIYWDLQKQIDPQSLNVFAETAYSCLNEEQSQRPNIDEIVTRLEKALELQLEHQNEIMNEFGHLRVPLQNILSATNNFDEENVIGESGFDKTYKGQLLWSGELIDVTARRLNKEWDGVEQMFWMQISMLSSLKHKNVVSLVGFCDENHEKILITRYEIRGSLNLLLSDPMLLTWVRRLEISVGVAHALSYIHYDEPRDFSVIHRRIHSNIVLINDDWEPKLSGFELSIKIKASQRHHSFHTNILEYVKGYADPTYIETKSVNYKSDIYSFGTILFELLCGRTSISEYPDNKYLATLVNFHYKKKMLDEIIDPVLRKQMDPQSFNVFAKTAYDCLNEERSRRPDISEVVTRLESALKLQMELQWKHEFPDLSRNVVDGTPSNHLKTIKGLKLVRDEIQVALKIVCESHNIGVAQVWISYEDENHVPFSFSSEDTQTTRMLALKLTGYNSVNEDSTACHLRFKEYYDACNMVPLKKGEELVEKTLQDYQPRFCENISQLGTDTLMAWLSTDDVACSGFTICMSIDTGDFNCAFEFIWHHNPNYVLLLEALLLTLKRHLPRFKFASGAELGEQLRVIDVEKSTETKTTFFKIFKGKRLSAIPEAMNKGKKAMLVNYNALPKEKRDTTQIELSRENIEQHYGKTMKKAAEELGVSLSTLKRKHNKLGMSGWQGPYLPQRKAYNSNKNQSNKSHTHEKDNGVIQDPSPATRNENIVIKAEYADDIIKLRLGISDATFVTIENEIGKKFKLKHGTFKIKYLDEDEEWILMTSDQDMSDCVQNSRNVVRLRVLLHNQ